ncbi:ROK family glucokinase [Salimicrobium halophilum]|uniref:Glucokinase n=1 Tax=Salimicrobium halophilum TaxID=86666 RepID=A0A1G8PTC8_9BACI|nr:ROK family glucokinase [Salimicrobium halophilum]SDI95465.1 glucokinase [Salimicrobium halophilum]
MEERKYIGIDIGGTTVKLAVLTKEGEMVHKWEIPTAKEEAGKTIVSDIAATINDTLNSLNVDKTMVEGIGAGAPGFIDQQTGYVYEAINIGWKEFDMGRALSESTGFPVWADNDANIAALGEKWLGAGKECDSMLAVTLGTGVGGGIIVNKKVINGANGTGGEIGHITVKTEGGHYCNCGRYGCLETETSATAIARKAAEVKASGTSSYLHTINEPTAKDVFEGYEKNDEGCIGIVSDVTDQLGLALANLAVSINPEKIVIGGGVSKAGESLLNPLKKAFESYALPRVNDVCDFSIAKLGNDAGVIGGAYLVKTKSEK